MTARILLSQVAANRSLPRLPDCCSYLLWAVSDKLQDGMSAISSKLSP
jgi:hypothetical protein